METKLKEKTVLLKDLIDLFKNKSKYKQLEQRGHIGIPENYDEGNQGEYNEKFIFYKHPGLPEGVFMRETYQSDSYGDNFSIESIDFVQGKEKTIKVYEPI